MVEPSALTMKEIVRPSRTVGWLFFGLPAWGCRSIDATAGSGLGADGADPLATGIMQSKI